MRFHQKPIPRSLARFCCLLYCSPCIRLPSVFCCWLLMLDCTVCTCFQYCLGLLLSCYLLWFNCFDFSMLLLPPSVALLPSSLRRHWIYCSLLESNLYTAFPHISASPMLTSFSLLRPTRQLLTPPWQCRNYTGQISWFSLRHHLNQFIGQSFGNQEIADTLDSICPNTRLGSHFVEGRIVQWTDATA